MPEITAVQGDITDQKVDAIVAPANTALRGGGGADGAIRRAGGPALIHDCVERYPSGLTTGDAGWTTAGNLPARWVIHAVGPNYTGGTTDRSLLESCYRRALEVADELGARTVAVPLIGTGSRGWPQRDAIAVAIESITAADTRVHEVRLVAFDGEMHYQLLERLASSTPFRILQGVRVLHQRGYHRLRILPGMSGSGMFWRVGITDAANLIDHTDHAKFVDSDTVLRYTTGDMTEFAGGEVTVVSAPDSVADLILEALPGCVHGDDDPAYVVWFADLLSLVELYEAVPIAYAEHFDPSEGWEIGWGSGIKHPRPPKPPMTATPTSTEPDASG